MTHPQRACLAALGIQSLVHDRAGWRFDARIFSFSTVNALIERGLARRLGDRVIGVLVANDNGPM